ncbi:EamA family transporter RarD [Corynebacterium halotolerans]|uniref:EamA domain-containing protein n=1 Tax=Corynebacterium halotolerans YIM 70093 = DSM 44683 TaxID=1121362 RepID=M1NZC9_9CORY|nr:EamA family transporter RarD [Corynebacterium halotolerans]AGF72870.1 hypothetical protein A605_09340 [Corynebacterium halotolerans YIM 70093 = DSM 44683]
MIYGVAAYLLWGLMPAFFPLLLPAGPLEILAHRIVWAGVIMAVFVTVRRGWGELRQASVRTWARMGLAGLLIAGNWLIYIIAVNSGHVSEAALGYFINPLVSVIFGVIFLRERLRRVQLVAVLIAAVGVLQLTFLTGTPPVLALSLALTFGLYGLIKKRVDVSAAGSLTAETLLLAPFALGYVVYLEVTGTGTMTSEGPGHLALLVSAGLVTAVPLLLFGMGAKLIPLSTIGMLQYLTPTMQMLWALFVVNEQLEPARWIGFIIIWIAVAVYLMELLHQRRQRERPGDPATVVDAAPSDSAGTEADIRS